MADVATDGMDAEHAASLGRRPAMEAMLGKGALFSAFPRDRQGACGTRGRRFLMGSP